MTTLKDIAKKIGVNVSTVSRALNDSPEISEETKRFIKRVARKMNYTPNVSAQSLVGKNTRSVGLVLPEIRSNYYGQISNCIGDELGRRNYSMIIALTNFEKDEEERAVNLLSSRKVDGILFISLDYTAIESSLTRVKKHNKIPIVLLDSFHGKSPLKFDHIGVGSYSAILAAIRYFVEHNRRNIGFIGDRYTALSRYPGFKKALAEAGVVHDERFVGIGKERFEEGGYQRMVELIRKGDIPDALFASYDNMAIGVLKAMSDNGIRPAQDVAVVGHDNIFVSAFIQTPLSTIEAPLPEIAARGVDRLMERIHGKKGKAIEDLLPAEFIARSTT